MKAEKTRRFIDMFLLSEKKEFPNNRLERQPSPKETQMLFHGVHVELEELERLAEIGRKKEESDAKAKEIEETEVFKSGGDKWHIHEKTTDYDFIAKCNYGKAKIRAKRKTGIPTCKHCLRELQKEREQK